MTKEMERAWKDLELALSYLDAYDPMQALAMQRIQKAQAIIQELIEQE